jgi:hypothetical protein
VAGTPPGTKRPAPKIDRARRAFELSLSGHPYRKVAELMKAEGYQRISPTTISTLIREYADRTVLPLAKEHVTREFERLLEQRVRLEKGLKAAWTIHDRRHVAYSATGGIVRDGGRTLRDDGPSLQALKEVRGFEDLILKNADAMARLFGYNAAVRTEVTITTETDRAIADLVGEMDARPARDTAPAGLVGS